MHKKFSSILPPGHQLASALPWTFISTIGTEIGLIVLSFLTGMLSARWLGPEGRGEFAIIILWPNIIAAVGNLGIRDALVYYQAKGEYAAGVLNFTALLLASLQSVILVGIGLISIPLLTRNQNIEVQQLSLHFLLFIPLNLFALYALGLLQGRLNIYVFNTIRISVNLVYLIGMLILWDVDAITLSNLTYTLLGANLVTMSLAIGKVIWDGKVQYQVNRRLIRNLFSYGIRNHLGSISNMLNQRMDQMLMAVVLTPAELGWYVVAVSSSGFVKLVSKALSVFTFPKIANAQKKNDNRRVIVLYSRLNITGTLLLGGILMLVIPFVIPLIYTSAFAPSIIPAEILIVATIFLSIGQNWAAAFQGDGKPIMLAKAEGISLLVTLIGLAILLPPLSIVGAALASLLAYGTSALFLLVQIQKNWGIKKTTLLIPLTFPQIIKVITSSRKDKYQSL